MPAANILEIRKRALERQINNVKMALTQPTGLFETIDRMIRTTRMANKETLKSIGITLPAQAITRSAYTSIQVGERLRQLLQRLRR